MHLSMERIGIFDHLRLLVDFVEDTAVAGVFEALGFGGKLIGVKVDASDALVFQRPQKESNNGFMDIDGGRKDTMGAQREDLGFVFSGDGHDGGGVAADADVDVTGYLYDCDPLAVTYNVDILTTLATTPRDWILQAWRRFFKKSTLTAYQLITYKDDGTTAVTTQAVSDIAGTQTQGAAT